MELIHSLCVTENAGLSLHKISYKINFAVDLINSCFILKIILYSSISFTGLMCATAQLLFRSNVIFLMLSSVTSTFKTPFTQFVLICCGFV